MVAGDAYAYAGNTLMRVIALLISRSHNTEVATAVHRNQSPKLKPTVEKACWRTGTYTTAIWSVIASPSAPHSHAFVNNPWKALRVSDRALKTLNN